MEIQEIEKKLSEVINNTTRRSQDERQQIFDSLVQRLGRYFVSFDRKYVLNCATGFNGLRVSASVNQRISRLLVSAQLEAKYFNTKDVWQNWEYFIKQR